jgi:hypothetical protein
MGDLLEKVLHGGALDSAVWHNNVWTCITICAALTVILEWFEVHEHQEPNKIYEEEHEKCDDDASLCKKARWMNYRVHEQYSV